MTTEPHVVLDEIKAKIVKLKEENVSMQEQSCMLLEKSFHLLERSRQLLEQSRLNQRMHLNQEAKCRPDELRAHLGTNHLQIAVVQTRTSLLRSIEPLQSNRFIMSGIIPVVDGVYQDSKSSDSDYLKD